MVTESQLERRIGYEFSERSSLKRALTHKSAGRDNNERLEFLGDAVLGYVVGSLLFRLHPDWQEDKLSLARAQLVRGSTLAEIASEIRLGDHIVLGSGEKRSGGKERHSILADTLEALIGAVHQDGGIASATSVVEGLFLDRVSRIVPDSLKDSKTLLQELLQAKHRPIPEYEIESTSGADHAKRYTVVCRLVDGGELGRATASSRRAAEKAAAAELLDALAQSND